MTTRTFTCKCGYTRDYNSTLATDHEARKEIQTHNLKCPQGF